MHFQEKNKWKPDKKVTVQVRLF